jgi:hypothetical protein
MTIAGGTVRGGKIDGNGAPITVHATGNGDLYIKNLDIDGGGIWGLRVDAGATVHLDHVGVDYNLGGGISIYNAGFDIKDTTVDFNGDGTGGEGIRLFDLPASGRPRALTNVSIGYNRGVGLVCINESDIPSPASGILLEGTMDPLTNCILPAGAICTTRSSTCGAHF